MTENTKPERTSVPSAWVRRIRTKFTGASIAARRTMERLPGRKAAAVGENPAPEIQDAPAQPSADPAIGLWATVKRARLAILITMTVVQVVMAVIAWRIKVRRARQRGEPLDL